MPAIWLGVAAVAANVAGSASAAKGAKQAAAAQAKAAQQIRKDTQAFQGLGFGLIGDARKNAEGYIGGVTPIKPFKPIKFQRSDSPNSPQFVEGGSNLSRVSFDVQTGQKRENLGFALGETYGNLRKSQNDFTALASGDTGAFTKELQASAFGALAGTAGGPAGAFANVSAKNLFGFRTEGLRNSLAISDFFAEQGTVDPVDPLPSIFALAEFEQEENRESRELDKFNRTIDFEVAKHNSSLSLGTAELGVGLEQFLLNSGLSVASTGLDYTANSRLIEAQAAGAGAAANGQVLNSLASGLSSLAGGFTDLGTGKQNAQTSSAYASFLGGSSGFFG
jgi:hypothetical protein